MNVNFKSTNGVENEDPHFNNVSLLLHMDGANNSEVFLDSSPFNKTISPFASPKISASIKKFGTGAGSFDGVTQYLIIPNNGFDFGTGDFTVEFWAYKTSGGDSGFVRFFNSSARWVIELGDGPDRTKWGNTNGEILFANGITQNQWVHVAFTRHNGTLRVFFDGIQQSSVADNFNYTINGTAAILGQGSELFYYPGYLDEFRITKGVARYTGNFTPPTAAFPDTPARKSLRFLKSNDGKKTLLRPVITPLPFWQVTITAPFELTAPAPYNSLGSARALNQATLEYDEYNINPTYYRHPGCGSCIQMYLDLNINKFVFVSSSRVYHKDFTTNLTENGWTDIADNSIVNLTASGGTVSILPPN